MTEASVRGRGPEGKVAMPGDGGMEPASGDPGSAAPASAGYSRLGFLWVFPVVAAVAAYSNTLPPDFGTAVHQRMGEELGDITVERLLFQNSWYQSIRSYSPLALATFKVSQLLGASAGFYHFTNVLFHAAASLLVYLLLREILGRGWLAAAGGVLFAVLPILSDTVANIWARADLLGGMALLGTWLLALRNSSPDRRGGESLGLAFAASLVAMLGLFAREGVAVVLPIIFVGSWLLGRRIPWLTAASTASAILAFLAIRKLALADTMGSVDFVQNPLVAADFFTWTLNSLSLFALYAAKVVLPLHLSFDYGYDELQVLSPANPLLWFLVLAVVAAAILGATLLRRRAPIVALAVLFFLLALLPYANLLYSVASVFAERYAYAAALAYPLALCGTIRALGFGSRTARIENEPAPSGPGLPGSRKGWAVPALAVLCLLAFLYGARTFARNPAWAVPAFLRVEQECPRSAMAHLRYGESSLFEWATSRSSGVNPQLLEKAWLHINKALEIYPGYGQAELMAAKLLFNEAKEFPAEGKYLKDRQQKFEQAVARFTAARDKLAAQIPPLSTPVVYRLRGEAYLYLAKPDKAFEDFDVYIKAHEAAQTPAEPVTYNFRGLAAAQIGRLDAGLRDFNVAVSYRQDVPEFWNNRGYCRFQLKDYRGALEDYGMGLAICEKKNILVSRQSESVYSFLARMCDVYEVLAKVERTAGNEAAAKDAAEKLQQAGARMKEILQSQSREKK